MSEIENAPKPDQNTVAPTIGTPQAQRPSLLSETDWWKGMITNTNRMAVDEEFRESIAKDLS